MTPIEDHPLRYQLANELHARPFPVLKAPCQAAFLAIKRPTDAAARDRDADLEHLVQLLDRHGAPHPQPGATHYSGKIGRYGLKWENHTEFVTYTVFSNDPEVPPFDPSVFDAFPREWLAAAPGQRITSASIRVEEETDPDRITAKLDRWFVAESRAVSSVLDDSAVMAGDFLIDPAGHVRFALFVRPETGDRRIGRVVQRICEIETYKAMSMLGLARVRAIGGGIGEIDQRLTALMAQMSGQASAHEATLRSLLEVSSELERIVAETAFRFGATGAYAELVRQRIEVLREERFGGGQTFAEFMTRRFEPAMRTVVSVERQLATMAERATRAANLLRTRVDVERSAQNQKLLESMNQRADLQLRLQRTVEGLSVVAISYYAVNLLGYALYPIASGWGVEKSWLTAGLTPLVILLVWLTVRRIRNTLH